jgi:hypothetical protein
MYRTSEIEWPVVRHYRDKKKIKGSFERVGLHVAGGLKGLAEAHSMSMTK